MIKQRTCFYAAAALLGSAVALGFAPDESAANPRKAPAASSAGGLIKTS